MSVDIPASTHPERSTAIGGGEGHAPVLAYLMALRGRRVTEKGLLRIGICGTAVTALCCFTPVLVVLLGAVGLSAAIGWLDYVLWPALVFFLGLTVFALWKRRSA
jgi:mercuric ion transport protein